jgi:general secretion pathway protein A
MSTQPFLERMPVERIWQNERTDQALVRLQYMLHTGTIALVTGQTGVGKSLLLKMFLQTLSANHYNPVYLHITQIKAVSFLKGIVAEMGEVPKHTKERVFSQILDKAAKTEATTVIIVDECQFLSDEALTDLRLLVSSALGDTPPIKIVLSGQEQIRQQLRRACLLDLAQRICVRYNLSALTQDQTIAYLDYQMRTAGSNDKVFEPEVKKLIHEYAGGIPRQINNIATLCLLQAVTQNTQKITRAIFATAVRESQI